MRLLNIAMLVTVGLLSLNCVGQDSSDKHDHATHQAEEQDSKLTLNNGKKWPLSESLMAAAGVMSDQVSTFEKSDSKDYQELATTLNEGVSTLINKCELPNGEAHENLHEWLFPYMELVKEMESSKDTAASKVIFEKIQHSFETFNQYFE